MLGAASAVSKAAARCRTPSLPGTCRPRFSASWRASLVIDQSNLLGLWSAAGPAAWLL